jgi:hypothetical protein
MAACMVGRGYWGFAWCAAYHDPYLFMATHSKVRGATPEEEALMIAVERDQDTAEDRAALRAMLGVTDA